MNKYMKMLTNMRLIFFLASMLFGALLLAAYGSENINLLILISIIYIIFVINFVYVGIVSLFKVIIIKFFQPSKISSDILIDPSHLLNVEGLQKIASFIKNNKELKFWIPLSFYDSLNSSEEEFYEMIKFYEVEGFSHDYLIDFFKAYRDYFNVFDLKKYSPKSKYNYFKSNLSEDDIGYLLGRIIYEEWVFLQEFSFIISKTKKIFEKFVKYGGISVEFSEKAFDEVIRKTMKLKDNQILTKKQKLRAISKWIAVGGSAAGSILNPILAVPLGIITGIFLLVDPQIDCNTKELSC